MANFKTHITTSSLIGVGIGAGGWLGMGMPLDQCLLAGGLCGLAGMLPDLDSPNSVPVRETVALSAALIPSMMVDRFEHLGMTHDQIVLASGILYFGIRFGVAAIFKRYTVHRGMWHSIPAALIAALLALMICSCDVLQYRLFKALAVFIGFISHLVLDEIYSIDLSGMKVRVKKSSGTALKFWGGNAWANFSTYAKLSVIVFVLTFDPMIMNAIGVQPLKVPQAAQAWLDNMAQRRERLHEHTHDSLRRHDEHENRSIPSLGDRIFNGNLLTPKDDEQNGPIESLVAPRKYERPPEILPIERWPQLDQSRSQNGRPLR